MKVVLDYITPNAEVLIGKYAGECYNAKIDEASCIRRAKKCKEDGHLATMRFAHAVFHVSEVSRICSHQFVRSKHLDFLQQSQRYVNQEDVGVVAPQLNYPQEVLFYDAVHQAKRVYKALIDSGVKKEDARFVLPEAAETSFYVVGNLQAWRDFIRLRADKHAQWEVRSVAKQINNLLNKECPNLFDWMA